MILIRITLFPYLAQHPNNLFCSFRLIELKVP